jgi:hypothetical protein
MNLEAKLSGLVLLSGVVMLVVLAAKRHAELLEVVGRRGDAAADFLWRNKGVLAGGAALTVFLANPEPSTAPATSPRWPEMRW